MSELNIGSDVVKSKAFELVIQVKDNQGKQTGKVKYYSSDTPQGIADLWVRNNGIKTKRRRKNIEAAAKTQEEIADGIKQANAYIEKIRKQKNLED